MHPPILQVDQRSRTQSFWTSTHFHLPTTPCSNSETTTIQQPSHSRIDPPTTIPLAVVAEEVIHLVARTTTIRSAAEVAEVIPLVAGAIRLAGIPTMIPSAAAKSLVLPELITTVLSTIRHPTLPAITTPLAVAQYAGRRHQTTTARPPGKHLHQRLRRLPTRHPPPHNPPRPRHQRRNLPTP